MIPLILISLITTCKCLPQIQLRNGKLISDFRTLRKENTNRNTMSATNPLMCSSQTNVFLSQPQRTSRVTDYFNNLTELPVATKYTRPLFDVMGKPILFKKSISTRNNAIPRLTGIRNKLVKHRGRKQNQNLSILRKVKSNRDSSLSSMLGGNREKMRRPNGPLKRTQHMINRNKGRSSVIPSGDRNAGEFLKTLVCNGGNKKWGIGLL